ncbi:hypothetical protein B0H15DRAFT_927158 [Mycena belliarum]|uniref:F-box domain-containing protein n=1 Tax=Mycena belliarum TaxID=1033014 RepID=A0AAD6UJW5_9AGAR|nr:hypothetical protein B0H15DRAFT_927158 [Mycena belliae]
MTGLPPTPRPKSASPKTPWVRLKQAFTRRRHREPPVLGSPSLKNFSPVAEGSTAWSSPARGPSIIQFDTPPANGSRNERLPIGRLPPEILSEVFMSLCAACELFDHSWVACSHVSSAWRQISLSIPDLWAHVVFSSPRWINVCIERSKSALLIIEVNMITVAIKSRLLQKLVCDVVQLADRVGRITLRFLDLDEQLARLLAGPFPRMTSMSLERTSLWNSPIIPAGLTAEPYPSLQNLVVSSASWFLPPLPTHLVSLELEIDNIIYVQWGLFAEALQRLSALRTLTLSEFPLPPDSSPLPRLPLPGLKTLDLSASPERCTRFVQILECTDTPQYIFTLRSTSSIATLFRTVLSGLSRAPTSMFLHRLGSTQAAFGLVYDDVRDHRVLYADICFTWMFTLSDSDFAEVFAAVSGLSWLDGIRWFLLANWNTIPQSSWAPLLLRLVSLQSLVVSGRPSSGLFWDLVQRLEDDPSDGFLPALSEIELSTVDCSAGGWLTRRPGINAYFDLDGARFLEVLICYLELRTPKLGSLRVNRCFNYTGAEVKLLRRLVDVVEWDGAGWLTPTYLPNGDKFGAVTINHNLLSSRPGYEEQNLSGEERWWRHPWAHLVPAK